MRALILALLIVAVLGAAAVKAAQEEADLVLIPKANILEIVGELNRLRGEVEKLNARLKLQGCTA